MKKGRISLRVSSSTRKIRLKVHGAHLEAPIKKSKPSDGYIPPPRKKKKRG